jgi:hypothetical protein
MSSDAAKERSLDAAVFKSGNAYLTGLLAVVGLLAYVARSGFPSSPAFPRWIAIWLLISSAICSWDASFVFNRQTALDSFNHPLWSPYKDYVQVDRLYGKVDNDFVWSQSVLNVLEICINLLALNFLSRRSFRKAAVTALVACAMTSSKTILYHVMEISCHGTPRSNTAQNDWPTFLTLYVFPNGVWIWVPMLACFQLGARLVAEPTNPKRS